MLGRPGLAPILAIIKPPAKAVVITAKSVAVVTNPPVMLIIFLVVSRLRDITNSIAVDINDVNTLSRQRRDKDNYLTLTPSWSVNIR